MILSIMAFDAGKDFCVSGANMACLLAPRAQSIATMDAQIKAFSTANTKWKPAC
jgi:hypothetical protein